MGTALNGQVLSETVSVVRRSESREHFKLSIAYEQMAMVACCAPIWEDYKKRHFVH